MRLRTSDSLYAKSCLRRPKKPKYTPKPRVAPDLPTLYDKLRWADPDSVFLESNVLSTVVEQLVASYSKDGHSPLAAVTWAARDLALLSQSSKAMHATAMDAWPDLDRVMADLIPPTEQCLLTLPEVEGISWVRAFRPFVACKNSSRQQQGVVGHALHWIVLVACKASLPAPRHRGKHL